MNFRMFLIHHFLETSANEYPEKEAVVHDGQRFSFLEINKKSNQIANWLIEKFIKKGDRVALILDNSIEFIISYYAILKTGAIVVPINTGIDSLEIHQILKDCSPKIVFLQNKTLTKLIDDSGSTINKFQLVLTGSSEINYEYTLLNAIFETNISTQSPDISVIDIDTASIIYTSGSTGMPKGVMLTHLNIVSNTRSIVQYLNMKKADRCLIILPFSYVFALSLLNTHFSISATVILDNRFTFPNVILKTMIEEKATIFAGVPATYSILINKSSLPKKIFPYLRYLLQAGGHLSADIKKQLIQLFPDKKVFIMYGATEASARLSYLPPTELETKLDSIGKSIPNVEMDVFNKKGEPVPIDTEGEIVARGVNIMAGYWNDPDSTKVTIVDGWYYTGDLGYKDQDGYFYVSGRKREMIKVGAYKVSALEIEQVIYRIEGAKDVAVIGVPDNNTGEAIKAVVVSDAKKSLGIEDIKHFCMNNLPAYKVPKHITFVDHLPKNSYGKILKAKVKKLVE